MSPGVTQIWKLHTCPAPQQASAHTRAGSQHTPPAHTPPSPHGEPVVQPLPPWPMSPPVPPVAMLVPAPDPPVPPVFAAPAAPVFSEVDELLSPHDAATTAAAAAGKKARTSVRLMSYLQPASVQPARRALEDDA